VVCKTEGHHTLEPYEFLTVDASTDYRGTIIEELGRRRAELKDMSQAPTGEFHFEYHITTRGLLGLKSLLMKKTRGTTVIHHMFEGYQPWMADLPPPEPHGSLVATEAGNTTSYAILNAQERARFQ
jgi:GTP-binding protein